MELVKQRIVYIWLCARNQLSDKKNHQSQRPVISPRESLYVMPLEIFFFACCFCNAFSDGSEAAGTALTSCSEASTATSCSEASTCVRALSFDALSS